MDEFDRVVAEIHRRYLMGEVIKGVAIGVVFVGLVGLLT